MAEEEKAPGVLLNFSQGRTLRKGLGTLRIRFDIHRRCFVILIYLINASLLCIVRLHHNKKGGDMKNLPALCWGISSLCGMLGIVFCLYPEDVARLVTVYIVAEPLLIKIVEVVIIIATIGIRG